jgi:hypothetical protein
MVNIFKKISRGANNVFKKIDNGASTFFKKTVPDIANKAGSALSNVGDQIAGAAKQTGNFLEKNAGIISDAAAGALYATGFGAPLATAVLAAGNTAQQVGGKVKRAGQDAQQGLNNLSNQVNKQSNLLSQKGLQAVASTKQQVINGANNAVAQANQTANNLKQGAINSANNALASAGAGFAVV